MAKFFVILYNYFRRHKALLYITLIGLIGVMLFFTLRLKFEENITRFFPDTKDEKSLNEVFNALRIKDKIIVMFSVNETDETDNDQLIESATVFKDSLLRKAGDKYINNIVFNIDDSIKNQVQDFVYDNLPIFLTDADYERIDSLFSEEKVLAIMQKNYSMLLSPAGAVLKDYVMRDPLGMAGNSLKQLQNFQLETEIEQDNGYLFTRDGKVLLMFITPKFGMGSTGENDKLITVIEDEIASLKENFRTVNARYFGGPSVSVYNARQIKSDSILTLSISLIIIVIFTGLVFKEKSTIPLIIAPVAFGGLFSLFMISILKGSISAIAVGSGSVVLGIALSYSIHMIVHQKHVSSVEQLIEEVSYPLTVGSFTTIGAFMGLLFTSSDLLRDFGLFASMALIGTTLFCLIYLPHFLKGEVNEKKGRMLLFIEKFNSYHFDKNKWLVGAIIGLTIICFFTSDNVGFESDMMKMNYEPKHLKEAEKELLNIVESEKKTIIFVSIGKNIDEAASQYKQTNLKLTELKQEGLIKNFASADYFVVPPKIQEERINKWNSYWTTGKKEQIKQLISEECTKFKFRPEAFDRFYSWLDSNFEVSRNGMQAYGPLGEWQNDGNNLTMFISQVQLDDQEKTNVYNHFQNPNEVVVFDRAYFTGKWINAINDDFYLVLYISSLLIFFTLLLSYGRIELALMSFLPMFISWIIIIGVMGIFGIQFNIITIILSTFIFGIGDDFSIFIMDGLINKYRTNKSVLNGHKTAIFFAAFTIIVGMGALVFAQHPALQSISLMSILGMAVVVLVSYTIPPIIFRLLISNPASKGLTPYTLMSLVSTLLFYLFFVTGCLVIKLNILLFHLLPVSKKTKRRCVCSQITFTCRSICKLAFFIKTEKINISKDTFAKPSIVIANHESFLDILYMLSLSSKMVMITNHWVWNSPFFGSIIRYAGYFFNGDGYETSIEQIKERIDEGYSITIFPEGTRSYDGKLKRFHKGAFYYAEKLNLDIVPVVIYGTGLLISKSQPSYIKKGKVVIKALPQISNNYLSWGSTYKERTKSIARYFVKEHNFLKQEFNNSAENSYFYHTLIKNYIYKGPVEEWYIRIKVKTEKNYRYFDRIIPHEGQITDIGCGYGPLCFMLKMLAPERNILGIDYDEDKIEVAQNSFLCKNEIRFEYADALNYPLPQSNVFILNDILHYMNWDKQQVLLKNCADMLHPEGMIIVRDANIDDKKKQNVTKWSEIFSTRIFGFNKTQEDLCFVSAQQIYSFADEYGMEIESRKNDKYTSNTIFVIKKRKTND